MTREQRIKLLSEFKYKDYMTDEAIEKVLWRCDKKDSSEEQTERILETYLTLDSRNKMYLMFLAEKFLGEPK